ncbi:MAG: septum site-determining protein MinC [Pseudomonadota bacterium]
MTSEDRPSVKLKGVGDGFWVTLDPARPEQEIKDELSLLFNRLKHLAINARVVIDTGAVADCDELIDCLGAFLKQNYDVGLVTRPPAKRSVPVERTRQRDLERGWTHHRSDVLMLRGRVRSGQKIETKRHIVIVGDVNPGAELSAGGDILVFGRLLGQVHAGAPSNEHAIVFALDFRPTQVQIGDYVAAGLDGGNSEGRAEYASVSAEGIVVQDYLKTNPFARIPWPEVV